MRGYNFLLLVVCVQPLLFVVGCQRQDAAIKQQLLNIELLRGDIIMCGGDQFGDVSFGLSCKGAARETFNLAISLLHSFEYEEAEKAFVKTIDIDPKCAMAYWGVAMSLYTPLWAPPNNEKLEKGTRVLSIAESLRATSREKDYLDAVHAYYDNWEQTNPKSRSERLEKAMESLYEKYANDDEAAIFYALILNATADPADKTYRNQIKAGQILEPLFASNPNHPGIAHYIIHSYDYPELAPRALATARKYATIAPASAHAQHMPSHIFTRLGIWDEAISSNLNSTASAICYADSAGYEGHWDEELHGMDYLVYAYLQIGDNQKAIDINNYLNTIKSVYPINFKDAYAIAAIPARIALENKDWQAAASLTLSSIDFPWENFPWQRAILHFTRALGSARLGNIGEAEKEINILQTLHQNLLDRNNLYEANQVQIQINAAQAWVHYARGKTDAAVALMWQAADMEDGTSKHPVTPCEVLPARELLADLLLAVGNASGALEAYEKDLKDHPNRFNGLYGAALALQRTGRQNEANAYFESLLTQASSAASDRPEIKEARNAVKKI